MAHILNRYTDSCQAIPLAFKNPHTDTPIAQNGHMRKVDISQVFGRNLKAAMEKAGLKQISLSKRSGVSQGVISEISRGVSSPTIETVNNLAHALGVQAWELLVDEPATRRAALERILGGNGNKH